jgi:hypothetical protein
MTRHLDPPETPAASPPPERRFDGTPAYQACRYCPYNQIICPSIATQE